ncbi:MAG: hypothetical protein NT150_04285 [Bacteroidetes bacterium]|nr:hypothetical protein [Bacteroidota bacterium]
MKAKILINSGEHSFSSDPSEEVNSITTKDEAIFKLSLFDAEGNAEVFDIPQCTIITVEGSKFKEEIVISKSLIDCLERETEGDEETVHVELLPEIEIWDAGFAQGFFFDLKDVPAVLKDITLK